jgi:hypothetical protein
MLGQLLGEASGRTTGIRVLPTEGQQVKVEVSFQGSGKLLGVDISDVGTYWQTVRPGGVLYGEGHVLFTTNDGEIADWTGFGVGKPTGPAPAAHYAVCGSTQTTSGKLGHLNTVAAAIEYDVHQDGSYQWKFWEWI